MSIEYTINEAQAVEAGQLLGMVSLTLDCGDGDEIHVRDIRILKSENGPVATLAPEFASFNSIFTLSPNLYSKVLAAALDAYKAELTRIETEPKPVVTTGIVSPVLADVRAEREAYIKAYPARARNQKTWSAWRKEWKRRKNNV